MGTMRLEIAAAMLLAVAAAGVCQSPLTITSSRRGEICLNGSWRFMPAVGPAAQAPVGDWGQIPVPGSWAGGPVPGPIATGKQGPWAAAKLTDVGRVWHETTVLVPVDWQGRTVLLDLSRVSTDAVVYANGVECGRIEWPNGSVDITKAVKAGEPATLRLLVMAVPEGQDVAVYMGVGNDQTWTQPAQLASRGIIGEAFLRSLPAGPRVSDVFVRPSVRQKRLALDVEVSGLKQAGLVGLTARLVNESGKVEQAFDAEKQLAAADTQTVPLEWPRPNPRLWDTDRPDLCALQLATRGAGLDDEYPQVFGFREFWLEGLKFLLNGTEIQLRPVCLWDEWNNAA